MSARGNAALAAMARNRTARMTARREAAAAADAPAPAAAGPDDAARNGSTPAPRHFPIPERVRERVRAATTDGDLRGLRKQDRRRRRRRQRRRRKHQGELPAEPVPSPRLRQLEAVLQQKLERVVSRSADQSRQLIQQLAARRADDGGSNVRSSTIDAATLAQIIRSANVEATDNEVRQLWRLYDHEGEGALPTVEFLRRAIPPDECRQWAHAREEEALRALAAQRADMASWKEQLLQAPPSLAAVLESRTVEDYERELQWRLEQLNKRQSHQVQMVARLYSKTVEEAADAGPPAAGDDPLAMLTNFLEREERRRAGEEQEQLLTRQGLQTILAELGIVGMTDEGVRALFDKYDADRDGRISLQEFSSMCSPAQPPIFDATVASPQRANAVRRRERQSRRAQAALNALNRGLHRLLDKYAQQAELAARVAREMHLERHRQRVHEVESVAAEQRAAQRVERQRKLARAEDPGPVVRIEAEAVPETPFHPPPVLRFSGLKRVRDNETVESLQAIISRQGFPIVDPPKLHALLQRYKAAVEPELLSSATGMVSGAGSDSSDVSVSGDSGSDSDSDSDGAPRSRGRSVPVAGTAQPRARLRAARPADEEEEDDDEEEEDDLPELPKLPQLPRLALSRSASDAGPVLATARSRGSGAGGPLGTARYMPTYSGRKMSRTLMRSARAALATALESSGGGGGGASRRRLGSSSSAPML